MTDRLNIVLHQLDVAVSAARKPLPIFRFALRAIHGNRKSISTAMAQVLPEWGSTLPILDLSPSPGGNSSSPAFFSHTQGGLVSQTTCFHTFPVRWCTPVLPILPALGLF